MKKLIIIFGGSVTFYEDQMNLFKIVRKKTGWKFKKLTKEKFITEIEGINVEIRFCWNPRHDKLYEELKKFVKKKFSHYVLSVPAKELVKKLKNPDSVLFVGHCGAFKGKKEDIHTPNEFQILLFRKSIIKEKDLPKIKPKNKIKINNILKGKIKGKSSKVITSNLTLSPDNMENRDKDILMKLGKKLQEYGDIVEKESYFVAKEFKNKPLGMLMISSDILTIKKHMMVQKTFNPSKDNLANNFINAIKVMTNFMKNIK